MNKRYKLTKKQYQMKAVSTDLIKTVKKMQQFLQTQENKKHGKKAQEVSFVYASRELNKFIKSMRGIV